jgi:predicted ATPase
MILDARNGITFKSDSNQVIPLYKLSSGEQNLVILYYRLVFETNSNTLLLVDEPENSMHVEWLRNMLSDYLEMGEALGCQMIIDTHSPIFINGHWDIAYDLFGRSYQDLTD